MEKIFVKPMEGGLVRDPVTFAPLPKEGAWKPRDSFWLRRVKFGDAIEDPPAEKKAAPASVKSEPIGKIEIKVPKLADLPKADAPKKDKSAKSGKPEFIGLDGGKK